ncbi:hypothetical protein OGAPHI_000433 [Ogataea philodendri]|uniref:Replication protein A C-terminal domain-containing protein n=1 Tax=Ogataea philodendri TaxID=1378263 RepID=A0A9P8PG94_9ASCO|nr:uncharacterized protein OGAPHI_000433 [Ogataea philodendri]KAH3671728.1 hypothetical protein OGAPHI_000433 [Ogataea philodendri]
MSGYQPYNNFTSDGTGYGNYNGNSGGFASDGPSSSQNRSSVTQSIIPVTIKEINEAEQSMPDAPFVTHGLELYYVSFVGIIRELESSQAQSTTLKIEDGTGVVSVRKWNDEEANEPEPFITGEYVKVVATIREFSGKKQIQTQTVQKVKDFNEIPYHFLSAIKVYLESKGSAKQSNHSNGTSGEGSLFVGNGSSDGPKSDLEKIFEFVQENSAVMTDGVPLQLIAQNFNIAVDEVEPKIATLIDDGRVYNGSDDTSFLAVVDIHATTESITVPDFEAKKLAQSSSFDTTSPPLTFLSTRPFSVFVSSVESTRSSSTSSMLDCEAVRFRTSSIRFAVDKMAMDSSTEFSITKFQTLSFDRSRSTSADDFESGGSCDSEIIPPLSSFLVRVKEYKSDANNRFLHIGQVGWTPIHSPKQSLQNWWPQEVRVPRTIDDRQITHVFSFFVSRSSSPPVSPIRLFKYVNLTLLDLTESSNDLISI